MRPCSLTLYGPSFGSLRCSGPSSRPFVYLRRVSATDSRIVTIVDYTCLSGPFSPRAARGFSVTASLPGRRFFGSSRTTDVGPRPTGVPRWTRRSAPARYAIWSSHGALGVGARRSATSPTRCRSTPSSWLDVDARTVVREQNPIPDWADAVETEFPHPLEAGIPQLTLHSLISGQLCHGVGKALHGTGLDN